jgi:hypothetical protein
VFENRVPRKIFGAKCDEVTGERKRLHNEELCSSPNINTLVKSRSMRWTGHVACMVEGVFRVLPGRPERKRPLVRSRRRCNSNIKWYVQELRWNGMDWMNGD